MTSVRPEADTTLSLALPHHDGSELYVLEAPEEPGGSATVRVRVPQAAE